MQSVIEQYKDAIVSVVGVLSGVAMLVQLIISYKGIVENTLAAIFYK